MRPGADGVEVEVHPPLAVRAGLRLGDSLAQGHVYLSLRFAPPPDRRLGRLLQHHTIRKNFRQMHGGICLGGTEREPQQNYGRSQGVDGVMREIREITSA